MPLLLTRTLCLLLAAAAASSAHAADLLVADRLTNRVYRYSESGELLGTVLADPENLNQPSGIALSADRTQLYVSSFQNLRVMRYDYNPVTGTASNPTIFAEGVEDGIGSPGGIVLSPDGSTVYVANLGGTGIARLNLDGSPAGAPLMFGSPENTSWLQFSGLAWTDTGELLATAFQDVSTFSRGAVARWSVGEPYLEMLIEPSNSLNGASSLHVAGNDLYVSGMFASNVQRFDLTTGLSDPGFLIEGIPFPQSVVAAPDGNGLLVGVLGFEEGKGDIVRYDSSGELVEFFISPGNGGFQEPTAMVVVPDLVTGDFNGDGQVDARDYILWRNTYDSTTDLRADANGDNRVDVADYLVWKGQYGAPHGGSALPAQPIPAPATLLLVSVGGLVVAGAKSRTRVLITIGRNRCRWIGQ